MIGVGGARRINQGFTRMLTELVNVTCKEWPDKPGPFGTEEFEFQSIKLSLGGSSGQKQ